MEEEAKKAGHELEKGRTWEKLIRLVPGLAGYQGREKVREADKLLRMALADRLHRLQERVEEVKEALVEKKELQHLGKLDLITRKMAQARDSLSFASYGYSGAFDLVQIEGEELERMRQFDLALTEQLEGLGRAVESFSSRSLQEGAWPEIIRELERPLEEFLSRLADRSQSPKA
jgi:hypothetical protein